MKYESLTINECVENINSKYFLPHIQRELVWKPQQIIKLFDSIIRDYPISTFLFWKISDKKKEITKLEFIKNYSEKSKNEINNDISKEEYWLVLDGQQRIQSFFIALKGSYNEKELFLNVLSNKPIEEDEEESEIIYETKFFKKKDGRFLKEEEDKKSKNSVKKLWVKIKDFALLEEDKLLDFIRELKENYEKEISYEESNILEKNIKKLHTLTTVKESVFYYLEKEEDYEKVLDIFIRTNSGGTKLSKSDLLFSVIKLKWKKIDAYNRFKQLIGEINNKGDFEFDNDFILKTSLVLINKDVKYKVENFNQENVLEIEKIWEDIENSIKTVIDLIVGDFSINSKKQLTSKNCLIPIIDFTFYNKIKTYQTDKKEIVESKKVIKKWLYLALLTNLFSSQTDELLRRFREVIRQNKGIFPSEKLLSALPLGKSLSINKEDFDKLMYNEGRDFFVLRLLYPYIDLMPISERNKPHKDHIFPDTLLKNIYKYEEINNIGNIQFLTATENESKNKTSFDEWIKKLDKEFIKKSFIPEDNSLWKIENYKKFIEKRRELMFMELKKIIGD